MAKSPLTFSSSSTWVFSAVSHICSTVIASRLERKVSPAPPYGWIDHPLEQHRVRAQIFWIRRAQRHPGAHDLADRDAPALARQLIAAPRPAHALEILAGTRPWSKVSKCRGAICDAPPMLWPPLGSGLITSSRSRQRCRRLRGSWWRFGRIAWQCA
jgi:hypothetical protein